MRLLPASPDTLEEALTVLRAGGVVAHATETCYGLACDMANPVAVARVFAIKNRPAGQPVSALFASVDAARAYVEWPLEAQRLGDAHLPGALTLILPLRADAPRELFPVYDGGAKTVGVRVSSFPLAAELVARFGSPLSTTSANVHGEPPIYAAQAIVDRFMRETYQPDIVIDSGELSPVPPSTVIDLSGGGGVRREGDIRV